MGESFLSSGRNAVIVFSSCVISMLIYGIYRINGLMFISFMDRFDTGRQQASFPFTVAITIRHASGPFVGYLGKRFGSGTVTLWGCLLSAIGIFGCYFAEDITTIIIFWGVIFGAGCGMGTMLISNILRICFGKHLDKANGIFLGGEGLGGFLFPVIGDVALQTYGTSGACLILAGVILHSVPAAMLLRHFEEKPLTTNPNVDNTESYNANLKNIELRTVKENLLQTEKHSDKCAGNDSNESEILEFLESSKKGVVSKSKTDHSNLFLKELRSFCESLSVFLDPAFLLIMVAQNFSIFGLSIVWTIIVEFARDVGVVPQEDVYILIGLALTDTIGRFTLGFITDSGYMSKVNFGALCLAVQGLVMAAFPWLNGFLMVMIGVCLSGFSVGGFLMIFNGIIALHVEEEKVILAYTCRLVPYPLLGFSQPFMIEYFRDTLKSYDGLFYFVAASYFLCTIVTLLTPMAARFRERKKKHGTKKGLNIQHIK